MLRKTIGIAMAMVMIFATASMAVDLPKTQVTKILEYRTSLSLTDSQVKKLEIIEKTTQQKLMDAKVQADIRLAEIEKFTSNWTDMNSIAVQGLVKEYYDFLANYKIAELEAIVRARTILDMGQLSKFQQLVTVESMMIHMEAELAVR